MPAAVFPSSEIIMLRYIAAVFALAVSPAPANPVGHSNLEHMMGLRPVSAPRLERLIADHVVINMAANDDWKVFYVKDGTQRGTFRDESDVGRWRVVRSNLGSELCSSWTKWRPVEKCFPVFLNIDGRLVGMDGTKFSWVGAVARGNPAKL